MLYVTAPRTGMSVNSNMCVDARAAIWVVCFIGDDGDGLRGPRSTGAKQVISNVCRCHSVRLSPCLHRWGSWTGQKGTTIGWIGVKQSRTMHMYIYPCLPIEHVYPERRLPSSHSQHRCPLNPLMKSTFSFSQYTSADGVPKQWSLRKGFTMVALFFGWSVRTSIERHCYNFCLYIQVVTVFSGRTSSLYLSLKTTLHPTLQLEPPKRPDASCESACGRCRWHFVDGVQEFQ